MSLTVVVMFITVIILITILRRPGTSLYSVSSDTSAGPQQQFEPDAPATVNGATMPSDPLITKFWWIWSSAIPLLQYFCLPKNIWQVPNLLAWTLWYKTIRWNKILKMCKNESPFWRSSKSDRLLFVFGINASYQWCFREFGWA